VRERGGAVADVLIFIGAVVVVSAIAGVACGSCASGAAPARTAAPAVSQYRECNDEYQDCRDQRHRGNFSPGPFDRSPVDVHDNEICVSLNCAGYGSTTTTTGPRQRVSSIACLVPAPWHCDPKREAS